jgi:hypothetical protein
MNSTRPFVRVGAIPARKAASEKALTRMPTTTTEQTSRSIPSVVAGQRRTTKPASPSRPGTSHSRGQYQGEASEMTAAPACRT